MTGFLSTGALKNAIDYLYTEWNNKAGGLVSYGSIGRTETGEPVCVEKTLVDA